MECPLCDQDQLNVPRKKRALGALKAYSKVWIWKIIVFLIDGEISSHYRQDKWFIYLQTPSTCNDLCIINNRFHNSPTKLGHISLLYFTIWFGPNLWFAIMFQVITFFRGMCIFLFCRLREGLIGLLTLMGVCFWFFNSVWYH